MKKTMCHHKLCGSTHGYEYEMYENSPQQDILKVFLSQKTLDGKLKTADIQ